LQNQGRNVDFSGAALTKPFKTGNAVPATCSQGEAFFKLDTGTLYGCVAANNFQPMTGGGGGIISGSGAPAGACSAGAFYLDTSASPAILWYCNSSSVWRQVLDTNGIGQFVITGQTGSAPSAPSAGFGAAWFDSASGVWKSLVGGTTASTVVAVSCPAGQYLSSIGSGGVPACTSLASNGIGKLSQWFHAASCSSGSAAASGAWQMRSDLPLTAACSSLIDGLPLQGALQFSNTLDQSLWLQVPLPPTWTSGPVNLKIVTYPGSGSGDARFAVATKCIAAAGSTAGGYNADTAQIRTQSSALTPQMTAFGSLNTTGCSPGNLLVIQLKRQNSCGSCSNGNMAAVEHFIGGSLEIQ